MNIVFLDSPKIARALQNGAIGVIPTDTIYGVHASVFSEDAIEKLYRIMKRNTKKPFIILISSLTDLKVFKITLENEVAETLTKLWPAKVSVVLPCPNELFTYLHRGGKTIAFRIPDREDLRRLIEKTGPLVSTSANPEGKQPAATVEEAHNYFGDNVDFYVNEGPHSSESSTLIKFVNGKIKVLREGAVKLSDK